MLLGKRNRGKRFPGQFPGRRDVKNSFWEAPREYRIPIFVHLFLPFQRMSFFTLPSHAHFLLLFFSLPFLFPFLPLPISLLVILSHLNQDPFPQ